MIFMRVRSKRVHRVGDGDDESDGCGVCLKYEYA